MKKLFSISHLGMKYLGFNHKQKPNGTATIFVSLANTTGK